MIKAIIFDCFGVLYVDASHDFYEKHVSNYAVLRPKLIELNKLSDYGLISQKEWMEGVSEVTGLNEVYVADHIQGTHICNQALLDFSQSLRDKYKIGMLSNIGMGAMDRFFSPEQRVQLFDAVVLSSEVGLIKPHPEIFKITAERLGCEPEECIMIDDIEENCAGADAAGMQSILYQTNEQTVRDLESLLGRTDA